MEECKLKNRLMKLEECFNATKETNQKFVGILIQMQGFEKPELIINEGVTSKVIANKRR
jgi:hypothetical protein